jgi:hypothetical protein
VTRSSAGVDLSGKDLVLEKDFRFFKSDFRKNFIPYKQQPEAGAAKVRKAL